MAFPNRAQRLFSVLIVLLFSAMYSRQTLAQTSPGNAILLNGTDYVRTTLWSDTLFNSESFTFELWFNANGPGVLVNEADTANTAVWDYSFAEIDTGGALKVGLPGVPTIIAGSIAYGTWHHLTITYDENNDSLTAYLDGTLVGTSTGERNSPANVGRTSVYCFGRGGPKNLGVGAFLNGRFDEIRIWRIALSAQDVVSNWNKIRTTDAAGLMAIWHFDTTNGSQTPDSRSAGTNPALYVPVQNTTPLISSTIPVIGNLPSVGTQLAVVVGRSVELKALARAQGTNMMVFFEWGGTTAYGNQTAMQNIGAPFGEILFTDSLTNLAAGTYHFRGVGTNAQGTFQGQDQIFVISGPVVTTGSAPVSGRNVQLVGIGNPSGTSLTSQFEWGLTTSYGFQTPSQNLGNGVVGVSFFESLTNLAAGTYHYRAVGVSTEGTANGQDQTFVIQGPTVSTRTPTVSDRGVQFSGQANPYAFPLNVYFEWGRTAAYGNTTAPQDIGMGSADVNFFANLTNLDAGTYHFRAVAVSDSQTYPGANATFVVPVPTVLTRSSVVSNNTARLQGTANAHGFPAIAYFEWGTTTNYGAATLDQNIALTGDFQYAHLLTNLAVGAYHYRAVVTSTNGTVRGANETFYISSPAGQALKLSGTDYVRTTTWSDAIFNNEDFTFELWFNASGPGELVNEADTANTAQWDYAFAEVFPGGVIKAGAPGVPTFTVGSVAFGTWHHLAITYSGSLKLMSAYLDGQPAGASAGDRQTPQEAGRTSVYCFGRGGQSNLGGGNFFSGFIDEVRIWRRALPPLEIAVIYNKILNATDAALMGYWHFDSFSSNQTYSSPDASGKNNPAWYVPQSLTIPLVNSTAPIDIDRRPSIIAISPRNITPAFFNLSATVNPKGGRTDVHFEYGRSNSFAITPIQDIGSSEAPVTFKAVLPNLEIGATYQYRLVASNEFGIATSSEGSFTKTGWAGLAYRLETNDYIRTAVSQNAYFTNKSITVELWFYPTKTGIIASETTFPTSALNDRAIMEVLSSGSVQAGFNGLTPLSIGDARFNQWNHVALRYNHTTQTMDAFLNGEKSPVRIGNRITPQERGVNGQFAFGRTAATKLGPGEYFGGDLDEIRVWSVARTDEDLSSARFNLLGGDEPGLVLNWRLDSETGSIIDSGSPINSGMNVGASNVVSTAPLTYGIRPIGSSMVELQFVAEPSSQFKLQVSSDLQNWTSISTNIASATGIIRLPRLIEQISGGQYYRIVAE